MPFTPFHMGPGLTIKAIGGRYFSVLVFGIAQIAMDIEPLIGLFRGALVLHGVSHTYVAAAVIALLVMLVSYFVSPALLRFWNRELSQRKLPWLKSPEKIGILATASGAFLGTFTHVALDSMLYADMNPLSPFSKANNLLGCISGRGVYITCVVTGIVGLAACVFRKWLRK